MGLFDKIKKKDQEGVQTPQSENVVPVEQGGDKEVTATENQTVMAEVSIDNNPFVEENVAVTEQQVESPEAGPTFDNIFNATPGDLIMPQQAPQQEGQVQSTPVVENVQIENVAPQMEPPIIEINASELESQPTEMPVVNEQAIEVTPFVEEQTKEDEITQIVSESVAASESANLEANENMDSVETSIPQDNVVDNQVLAAEMPSIEENITANPEIPTTPVIEAEPQVVESSIVPEQEINTLVENQPVVTDEVPESLEESLIEEPIIELTSEPMVEVQNVVEAPTTEVQVENLEEPTILNVDNNINVTQEEMNNFNPIESINSDPIVEEIVNVEPEIEANAEIEIKNNEENIVEETQAQVNEPIIELTSEPVVEEQNIIQSEESSSLEPVQESIEQPAIEPVIELTSEPVVEEQNTIQNEESSSLESVQESVEQPVIEPAIDNEIPSVEPTIEENSNDIDLISGNIEEITQDIVAGEAIIPEEIAANQEEVIELSMEPEQVSEEENIELKSEDDTSDSSSGENFPINQEEIEDIVIPQELISPIPLINEEDSDITIPSDEEQSESEESPENEITPIEENNSEDKNDDINLESSIEEEISPIINEEEISPIIEEDENPLFIGETEETNEETTQPEFENQENEEEISPIIEEEEQSLNIAGNEVEEQVENETKNEEENNFYNNFTLPLVEEDINVNEDSSEESDNAEENDDDSDSAEEEPIVLSPENPYNEETEFELPTFNQEENEEVENENQEDEVTDENENQEDITAPEFDFQSFMMPTLNQEIEEGPVTVESNNETATYISDPTPTKFCGNCGVMLTDDSSICPSCGEPID